MEDTFRTSDAANLIFGILSILAIIAGFFAEELKVIFWVAGTALLIFCRNRFLCSG